MRKEEIITGVFICLGLATLGFMNNSNSELNQEIANHCLEVKYDSITDDFGLMNFTSGNRNSKMGYYVKGKYDKPIIIEQSKSAETLADLVPNYPSKWITDYISVELITIQNGKKTSLFSENEILTTSQKKELNKLHISDEIQLVIKYKYTNTVSKTIDNNELNTTLTIIPNNQASIEFGIEHISRFFELEIGNEITLSELNNKPVIINFLVNEHGEISQTEVLETSGSRIIDQKLINTLKSLPTWTPATDIKGNPVSQKFELVVGNMGC